MRLKALFLLPILFAFVSCQKPTKEDTWLKLSQEEFNEVSSKGEVLEVNISCISEWTANSNTAWSVPSIQEGNGNYVLSIKIGANINQQQRSTTVTIKAGNTTKTIQINQLGTTSTIDSYHYQIPIIFHVLYKSKSIPTQYINKGRMAEVLENVNQLYHNSGVDMNLEFVLATHNPNGDKLDEPGVERILWDGTYPIDCDEFMSNNQQKYTYLLWDPNQYINVMIYNFSSTSPNYITLGISHLAYTTPTNYLVGLNNTKLSTILLENLAYPHCISINSLCIYNQSTPTIYKSDDVNVTLAHELGHYLGLRHVFAEGETGMINDCKDTDYCNDTPTYNRVHYDATIDRSNKWDDLVKREDCTRGEFVSKNIMDYTFSYFNQFSEDQRSRIRHVLMYSPLIPGPKKETKGSNTIEGVIDLPFRIIK